MPLQQQQQVVQQLLLQQQSNPQHQSQWQQSSTQQHYPQSSLMHYPAQNMSYQSTAPFNTHFNGQDQLRTTQTHTSINSVILPSSQIPIGHTPTISPPPLPSSINERYGPSMKSTMADPPPIQQSSSSGAPLKKLKVFII